jgi:hypothetical protein
MATHKIVYFLSGRPRPRPDSKPGDWMASTPAPVTEWRSALAFYEIADLENLNGNDNKPTEIMWVPPSLGKTTRKWEGLLYGMCSSARQSEGPYFHALLRAHDI